MEENNKREEIYKEHRERTKVMKKLMMIDGYHKLLLETTVSLSESLMFGINFFS